MTATTYTRSGSTFIASNRLILIVYTVSIFVSALLLFSVQPLFTKMILPRLEDPLRSGRSRWCFFSRCCCSAMLTLTI